MDDENRIHPGHTGTRGFLRVVGPLVLGGGLVMAAIGLVSFFSAFGNMGAGPPRYFWCAFVGLPMTALGFAITKFAYLGKVMRYVAAESAPVGKDTFNYMATETKDGVREITGAIRDGLAGTHQDSVTCAHCRHDNDGDAKFCDQCGATMSTEKSCGKCSESNDLDAQFCKRCGETI